MKATRIAIVGGGLSGLYAAFLLEQQGVEDYILFEARSEFGGRIVSRSGSDANAGTEDASNALNRFDLGPTWFWPALQPRLDRLVDELGLERFAQHEEGGMIIERSPPEPPMRIGAGYAMSPQSMRLVGGMGALIAALRKAIPPERLAVRHRVRRMRRADGYVELDVEHSHERFVTYRANSVLLAVPPRLAAATIEFVPTLQEALLRDWSGTATWMASHAKYIALYDTPFWRDEGLSGEARSATGPLAEIHDASMPGGSGALFGFFGTPARVRSSVSEEQLRLHCRSQLGRLFGPRAAQPKAELIKDWAADPLTATSADLTGNAGHGAAPAAAAASGVWHGCLTGIASEWSPQFPGYVAGAVDAAKRGIRQALSAAV